MAHARRIEIAGRGARLDRRIDRVDDAAVELDAPEFGHLEPPTLPPVGRDVPLQQDDPVGEGLELVLAHPGGHVVQEQDGRAVVEEELRRMLLMTDAPRSPVASWLVAAATVLFVVQMAAFGLLFLFLYYARH